MAGVVSVEQLLGNLSKSVRTNLTNSDTSCHDIIQSLLSCICDGNHTPSELNLILSLLFKPKDSLISFSVEALKTKTFKTSLKKGFELILTVLTKYSSNVQEYAVQIKDICYECIRDYSLSDPKDKAYDVIIKIVNCYSIPAEDLNIDGLVNYLYSRVFVAKNALTQTVIGKAYELFGTIAKRHPAKCCDRISPVVKSILNELNMQMKTTTDVKFKVIAGCMEALTGILTNFTHDFEEDPAKSREIYSYIEDASVFKEDSHRRVFQRAALKLFSTHLGQFWRWALLKHSFWLEELPKWANRTNKDDKWIGIAALRKFHGQACSHLKNSLHLSDPNSDDSIFMKKLLNQYTRTFSSTESASYELELALDGLAMLAPLHGQATNDSNAVPLIFTVILQRAQHHFSDGSESLDENVKNLATYVETLASICKFLPAVSNDQLIAVQQLIRLLIDCYPHQPEHVQTRMRCTLNTTILLMSHCQAQVFDSFLHSVVYQSITQTCGQVLVEDAELQKEMTGQDVPTYKSFLPVLLGIFNVGFAGGENTSDVSPETRRQIVQKLYTNIIQSFFVIVEKLDVGYNKQEGEEVEVKSDPESSLKGNNPQDHKILCNLANLYRDLLKSLDDDQLVSWLPQLVTYVINRSARFPLVSAFYKLLASILAISHRTFYFQDESEEKHALGRFIVRYLENVMMHCNQYKNDLQASCLLAIIATPVELMEPLLAGIPAILQTIFQLGQSFLPMAQSGLDALERWMNKLTTEQLRPILRQTLSSFDPFLRSRGIQLEAVREEEVQLSKRLEARRKRITESTELSKVQLRMLKLLSQLDSVTCLNVLSQPTAAITWTSQPTLMFRLPFPDQRTDVCLDGMLPRVVELALTSSDRQTKTTACEVLHALILLLASKPQADQLSEKSRTSLLKQLFPALLQLASGTDLVAKQLFHPLVLQLIHWYSSKMMLKTSKTEAVLHAIWNGITNDTDSALQDFSALCLREFVEWSIKQSTDAELETSPHNIKAVVRQINRHSVHPSLSKRIGAALAFNHLVKILGNQPALVDRFWIELIYNFVRNLALSTDIEDHPASLSIDYLLKVLRRNSDIFNNVSNVRRIPAALQGGSLRDLLRWLLLQCGSKSRICANKCRSLVLSITSLVSELSGASDLAEEEDMVVVCEGGGSKETRLPSKPTLTNGDHLRASLDCYAWCLKAGLITPSIIFRSPSKLLACVEYFINTVNLTSMEGRIGCEERSLVRSKCEVIVCLFDLFSLLGSSVNQVPATFWTTNFWNLIAMCIMCPEQVGFDFRDAKSSTKLESNLRLLLFTLRDSVDLLPLYDQLTSLSKHITDSASLVNDFSLMCRGLRQLRGEHLQFLCGLKTLHKTDLLRCVYRGMSFNGNSIESGVFDSLFDSTGTAFTPDISVVDYGKRLLDFAIILDADIGMAVSNILDVTEVTVIGTDSKLTRGEHSLSVFGDTIVEHLLQKPQAAVDCLLRQPTLASLRITLNLLHAMKYSSKTKTRSGEAVIKTVMSAWIRITTCPTVTKDMLVDLIKAMVATLPPSTAIGYFARDSCYDSLRLWLVHEITDSSVLLQHKECLIDLLPSITSEDSSNNELEAVLRYLQEHHFPVSCSELREGSVERSTFVAIYKALLRVLVTTGSMSLLHFISAAAADNDHACVDFISTALQELMAKLSPQRQVLAMNEVFSKFSSGSCEEQESIRLVQRYLVPLISHASKDSVTTFYSQIIQFIINTLEEKIRFIDNRQGRQLLVRKIGVVQLLETLFCRCEKDELTNPSNPIMKEATVPKNERITKYFGSSLLELRKLPECNIDGLQELFRKLLCCVMKTIVCLCCNYHVTQNFFATYLFDEKGTKTIWRKLVPTHPKFSFPIDFDDYPKVKKQLVQIRCKMEEKTEKPAVCYLLSQSLFNSSLEEDITRHDFSLYNVREPDTSSCSQGVVKNMGVELEEDILNQHECMATFCASIKYYFERFPTQPEIDNQRPTMPQWMEFLKTSLKSQDQPENCKVFIIKLIMNCQSEFKPYASGWIDLILQCIAEKCFGETMNYLIHDIVLMLSEWSSVAIPVTANERFYASEFLRWLVLNTSNSIKNIFNYNVEVVRCIVQMWKSCTSIPYQELLDLITPSHSSLSDPLAGIRLADIFLANNILPFNETGKISFYKNLLLNLEDKRRDVYRDCAFVIGRILKVMDEDGSSPGLAEAEQIFLQQVVDVIKPKSQMVVEKGLSSVDFFIITLHEIQKSYPPISYKFTIECIGNLNMVSKYKEMVLEILTSAVDSDFRFRAFDLLRSEFPGLLAHQNNLDIQTATLKLVDRLMPSLDPDQMNLLLPHVLKLQEHKSSKCRSIVYDIAAWIFDNYKDLNADSAKSQVKDCKPVLIAGLADTDKELQEKLNKFWTMNSRLASDVMGRFTDILKVIYNPSCEDIFLPNLVSLLLQICEQTNEFNENISPHPLSMCTFQDYKVSGSFRMQNAAMVPLFADTLASQMASAPDTFTELSFQLRATQSQSDSFFSVSSTQQGPSTSSLSSLSSFSASLNSYSSFKQGPSFGTSFLQPVNADESNSQPREGGLKRMRFTRNKQKLSQTMAARNTAKSEMQKKHLAEATKRREGNVTLTRKYRKGDLPDIEIPYSGIINSLRALAKQDELIARQLVECIKRGLEKNESNDRRVLTAAVDNVLRQATCQEPTLVATMLSLVEPDLTTSPASLITEVSKKSHQLSLGVRLLEEILLLDDVTQPSKRARMRSGRGNSEQDTWMSLAEIYHSMEETDVVQGVFEEKMEEKCAKHVREALQAEEQHRWKKAMQMYEEAAKACNNNLAANFLFEACFKAYSHLSFWKDISQNLKSNQLENNLENIWEDEWNKEHLLPWMFLSEIHCSQNTSTHCVSDDFNKSLTRWMSQDSHAEHIKTRVGEYLSVILMINKEPQRSKLTCEQEIKQFLSRWQQLDPLCYNLRAHHLLKLHPLMDIHSFFSLPPVSDSKFHRRLDSLLSLWSKNTPDNSTNLVTWETQAVYRNIFASSLETIVDGEHLKKKLRKFKVETQLKTAECALSQDNFHVAQKYLGKVNAERLVLNTENRLKLDSTKFALLRAKLEPDPSAKKLNLTLDSWNGINELRQRDKSAVQGLDQSTRLNLHLHTADFFLTLYSVVQRSPSAVITLPDDKKDQFYHLLDTRLDSEVLTNLKVKVVDSYLDAISVGLTSSYADSYLNLARFCHQIDDEAYTQRLIESLLRAMKYGSAEARRLFPCLLQLPLQSYSEAFQTESEQVPEWMFLSWSNQLLASLDTEIGGVLTPLLLLLAEAYPVALQFPFQLSREMFQNKFPHTATAVKQLAPLLRLDGKTINLVNALSCVCNPEQCLVYHLERLKDTVFETDEFAAAFAQLKFECYPYDPNDEETNKFKGKMVSRVKKYTDLLKSLKEKIDNKALSKENLKIKIGHIMDDLRNEVNNSKKNSDNSKKKKEPESHNLQDFCPWLLDGFEGGMEIPGQYTGDQRPLPHTHITISAFSNQIIQTDSLRAPIQVTVFGNDAKEHKLLVKFGEDLRQDQRIQQLFRLMNQLLENDPQTSRRRLYVDTYMVCPLSSRLGLIGWVDNTCSLIDFMISNRINLKERLDEATNVMKHYHNNDPSKFFELVNMGDAFRSYKQAVSHLPKFMLKDALMRLAASPEAFVHLRNEMLSSHACLSACHWLLGIGDRHLGNTLVSSRTGRFIGIDFGHAFGTATSLIPIPELIPFRLTPQILNLAAPLRETGVVKETMVHTLHVLRDNSHVLLAAMALFVHEPSIDWLKAAKKMEKAENRGELNWYPEAKISAARRKLEGVHPRIITEEELTTGKHRPKVCQILFELLRDTKLSLPLSNLSARQQVECLIDQATNEKILCKTYLGWKAFA